MPLLTPAARYFDEVARQGSVRRAAARLNAAASAVNRQILNLEAEYGVPLFERLPRGMRLTAAGELLLNEVRRWQGDLDRARRSLLQMQGLQRGHAAVGLMECLADDFAPRIFADLQTRHRGITLEAFVGGTVQVAAELAAGRLEVAVAFNVPESPEIKKLWSTPVPVGFVMAADHPLARQKSVHLSDCVHYPLVLPSRSLSMRALIDTALAKLGIDPGPVMTSNSIDLIKATVRHGERISVLSRIDVHREVEDGDLAFRTLADGRIKPEILSICVPARRPQSPTVVTVVEVFRRALMDMAAAL